MQIDKYRKIIKLDEPFEKRTSLLSVQQYEESLDHILSAIAPKGKSNALSDKRKMLRATLNTLPPYSLSEAQIESLDGILQYELKRKSITSNLSVATNHNLGGTKISVWLGDITTLEIDAIVNAANGQLEGCYQPLHACIDNAIHSASGVQLRNDCSKIIELQGHLEKTGQAKITRAYNLPSRYVIHTVGPIVNERLTEKHKEDLRMAYTNCLNICKEVNQVKSVAFCGISTGLFGFPKKEAAGIAFQSVVDWLDNNPNVMEHIVFNVFDEESQRLYHKNLENV